MKPIAFMILAALFSVPAPALGQPLPEGEIAAAIALGRSRIAGAVAIGNASDGMHQVLIVGPFGRIVDAAAKAAREYRPFDRADVTEEMLAPTLTVSVVPNKPLQMDGQWLPRDPVHVVVRPRDALDLKWIIQPLRKVSFVRDWTNSLGMKIQTGGLIAEFPLGQIPRGDFEVVISHASGPDQIAYAFPTKRAMARLPMDPPK